MQSCNQDQIIIRKPPRAIYRSKNIHTEPIVISTGKWSVGGKMSCSHVLLLLLLFPAIFAQDENPVACLQSGACFQVFSSTTCCFATNNRSCSTRSLNFHTTFDEVIVLSPLRRQSLHAGQLSMIPCISFIAGLSGSRPAVKSMPRNLSAGQ